MAMKSSATNASATDQPANPWGSSLDKLKEWDPKGAELLLRVGTSPWTSAFLPRKEVELISLALGQYTRAGIEDNLWNTTKGVRMSTIQMIERHVRMAEELGRAIPP
jgi:sugar phosphate isomerase/epimerase